MKRLLLLSLVSFAFCFANGQALQLQHPTKGDVWPAFSVQRIQWQFANVDNIKIEVSADSARTWSVIQSSYPASAGYYDWTVVNKPSDSCFIRISDVANPSVQSSNYPNNPFRIPRPTLSIDPVETSVFGKTVLPLSWSSTGTQNISLFVTYDNFSSYQLIAYNVPATRNFYNWIVKDTAAANCYIIIQAVDNTAVIDTIKQAFSVKRLPTATVAKYRGGSYDGHSSATNKVKSLQLLAPNKKEQLMANTIFTITWSSTSINQINIKYSTDSGATWLNISSNVAAALSAYNWTVPATPSARCLVKITDTADATVFDISDTAFTIKSNSLRLTSPAQNETVYKGQVFPISWTSSGISKINISYLDGAVWKAIINGLSAANEVYNWVIPSVISDSVKLKISDYDDPSAIDTVSKIYLKNTPVASVAKYRGGSYDGHATATNKTPFVMLLQPNGNERLASALPFNITWASTAVANVDLALSADSGRTWQKVVSNYPNSQSYLWTVPGNASTKCVIRIRSSIDSTVSDISDSVFTILAKTIDLVTDTTSTRYLGTAMPLEWTQRGIEKVSLSYKTSLNGTWQIIKDGISPALEVFNWVLPSLTTDSVWIKIFDTNDPTVKDEQLFASVFKVLPLSTNAKYKGGSFDGHAFRSTNNKISIFKPAANDTLKSGSNYPISWISGNVTDSVTLQYSLDSGATWKNIIQTPAVNGQYLWTVPSGSAFRTTNIAASKTSSEDIILSNKCIVRAVAANTSNEVIGITSKTFSIEQPAFLVANYYWVGGTGLWSDYSHHWATTSGGATFYSQPPSPGNNVFFDANSFSSAGQTVTVDVQASCNNMDWTGATNKPAMLVPPSNKLTVYGSLKK